MGNITRVLCVCKGNGDRSPMMSGVLQMLLDRITPSGSRIHCESAGILEIANSGGGASSFMVKIADRIGIDLSKHKRRWINKLRGCPLSEYGLFVCVDEEVAAYVMDLGVDIKKICNAQISNPWPSQFQQDFDDTAEIIMGAMFRVVTRHFSSE